jgi:uncharacterized protein (TIGR00251 family)
VTRDSGSQWCQWQGDDLILRVHAQPRAAKDELVGPHGDNLKIRITAPPVDGKANAHLIKFLAKSFGVPKAQVELLSGETGRSKRFRIHTPSRLPPIIPPRV